MRRTSPSGCGTCRRLSDEEVVRRVPEEEPDAEHDAEERDRRAPEPLPDASGSTTPPIAERRRLVVERLRRVTLDATATITSRFEHLERAVEEQVLVREAESEIGEQGPQVLVVWATAEVPPVADGEAGEGALVERVRLEADREDANLVVLQPADDVALA